MNGDGDSSSRGIDPLKNYASFQGSLRNFAWLKDIVPGATDLDLLVERNRHFLVVELEPWFEGVHMPYGQHKALYHLSLQPNTSVYLVGETDNEMHLTPYNGAKAPAVLRRKGRTEVWWKPERFHRTNEKEMRTLVLNWWNDATATAAA